MKKQEKEFDRSVCFTFYNSFHEQIMDVKRDFGLEQAFEVYEAIVNYGLYGKEIEKGKLRTLVGNATIEKVEGSQANREKWFDGENFEQTRLVAEYMRDHPNTSQRTIAAATGVGKTKVGKVQKSIRESEFDSIQDYLVHIVYPHLNVTDNGNNCNNSNNSNNIVTETEGDQRDQSLKSLSTTELADAQTIASTMPTADAVPIEIFRNGNYKLGKFTKVSIDNKTKNEHMYNATHSMNDDSSLAEVLDCAKINGVDKDYACSYIANNF